MCYFYGGRFRSEIDSWGFFDSYLGDYVKCMKESRQPLVMLVLHGLNMIENCQSCRMRAELFCDLSAEALQYQSAV